MEDSEKDVIRLRTVRALSKKGKLLIGEEAFAKDPLGIIMMDAIDELESRTTDEDLAALGLKSS